MARFYALIANDGKLVRPHLVESVQEGGGSPKSPPRTIHTFTQPAQQPVGLDPTYLAAVQDGLYQATHSTLGTATSVFGTFPETIAGKTGTAEKFIEGVPGEKSNQSWWCGYAPAALGDTPTIAVCAVIENGGHGGDAAAPAALKLFEQYFHKSGGPLGTIYSD